MNKSDGARGLRVHRASRERGWDSMGETRECISRGIAAVTSMLGHFAHGIDRLLFWTRHSTYIFRTHSVLVRGLCAWSGNNEPALYVSESIPVFEMPFEPKSRLRSNK